MGAFSIVLIGLSLLAPPPLLSVQGTLTNAGGQAVDGTYPVGFQLFDAPEEGNPIWPTTTPQVAMIAVEGGVFSATLNGVSTETLAGFSDVWLQVGVVGETPMARVPLRSVPFALVAGSAESLACTACVLPGSLAVPGAATAGTLTVQGLSTLETLTVTGQSTLAGLSVSGIAHLAGFDLGSTQARGMLLENADSAPVGCDAAHAGYVYFDTTSGLFKGCTGAGWATLQALPPTKVPWTELSGVPDGFADNLDNVGIDGSGEAGRLARFDSANTITGSTLIEKAGKIGVGEPNPTSTLTVAGDIDTQGHLIHGEPHLPVYALAFYIGASASRVGSLGSPYGLLACYPSTSDIEPVAGELMVGWAFDIGGSGSPSSCMSGAPDLGKVPCARIDIQSTTENSHDAYGVVCSTSSGLAAYGFDFETHTYKGSGGLSDTGINTLPVAVGQMVCTKKGYACVKRLR